MTKKKGKRPPEPGKDPREAVERTKKLLAEGAGYIAQIELQQKAKQKFDQKQRKIAHRIERHTAKLQEPKKRAKLTPAERRKIKKVGRKAYAQTPKQARNLAILNGHIGLEREKRALSQYRPNKHVDQWLEENLGFKPGATLCAAHKGLRAEAAFWNAKLLRRFYRRKKHKLYFHFITIIHDGWHTLDRDATIKLYDIKERVRNVMRPHCLDYVGVIEFDAVKNYPLKKTGLLIMPHIHLVMWTDHAIDRKALGLEMSKTTRLVSGWGAQTVVVSKRLTESSLVHHAYYMFEPAFKCKTLQPENPNTGKRRLKSVYKAVPPHLTLRLSEILANCTLKDLIVSSKKGLKFKAGLLTALRKHQRKAGLGKKPTHMTAAQAFDQLRATTKRGLRRSPVRIMRKRPSANDDGEID